MRRAATVAGALLATLGLLEGGARLAAGLGLAPGARPVRGNGYWHGDDPVLGVWREPHARFRHTSDCFDVEYRTNGVGARDRERREDGPRHRVLVLGDSFLAGWGLPEEARLSNRLEAATGVPHANFAMAHFGPYQSLLVYEHLARRFAHDAVLVSIVPVNDFGDIDLGLARELDGYEYRYRPYLVDGEPFDYREPRVRRALRRHSYLWNLVAGARASGVHRIHVPGAPRRGSYFYDFGEPQAALLEEILGRLAAAVGERPLAVLLVPTLPDLRRFEVAGPDPLGPRLAAAGFRVVDLLPVFAAETRAWERYFHACDYHWSAYANEIATREVRRALAGVFYDRPEAPLALIRHQGAARRGGGGRGEAK